MRTWLLLWALLFPLSAEAAPTVPASSPADGGSVTWYDYRAGPGPRLHVYLFWSPTCPHCRAARAFLEPLAAGRDDLVIHSHDITGTAAGERFRRVAGASGASTRSVPAIAYCGRMVTGFSDTPTHRRWFVEQFDSCRQAVADDRPWDQAERHVPLDLPLLGPTDPQSFGLPALTLSLGLLDSINPCAFFVLLFLLSLMVHLRSRARMALVGGLFVLVSGAVYFAVMTAWLNVFLVVGQLAWITALAGGVALVLATLNIKDFLLPGRGPSASIPEGAKPGLFRRMRGLLNVDSLPALLTGTLVLAVSANSYELLCTAGFPMIYTRILSLSDLSTTGYYAYLALYNLVYILPLMLIVTLFVTTLGSRKLSEREGRVLKLLSGLMMLQLGLLLLLAPQALTDLRVAVSLPLVAVLFTLLLKDRVLGGGATGGSDRRPGP